MLQVNRKPGLPMLDSMLLVAQSFPLGGSAGSLLRGRPVDGARMSLGQGSEQRQVGGCQRSP